MSERRKRFLPLKVCRESVRKWKNDQRIWSVAVLVCVFEWTFLETIRQVCTSRGMSVSCWVFPFLFGNSMRTVFFFLGILLLFCDAPFIDSQQIFIILRSGKRNWFIGKLYYLFVTACSYFFWMFSVSVLEMLPYVGFSLEWKDILTGLSINGRVGNVYAKVSKNIIRHFTPIQATLLTYVLCVLVGFFLGLLIFYINLYRRHNLGVGVALFVVLLSGFMNILPTMTMQKMQYISPLSWVNVEVFAKDYGGVPIWYPFLFLGTACALLIWLIMRKIKSYNIEALEEV